MYRNHLLNRSYKASVSKRFHNIKGLDMFSKFSYNSIFSLIIIFFISLLSGCITVPNQQVWRPWTRTFDTPSKIPPYSSFHINIAGTTSALIGDETLLQSDIKDKVKDLITRRGYIISNQHSDYNLLVNYKTFRNDKVNSYTQSTVYNRSNNFSYTGSYSNNALGVLIASAVFGLSNQTNTSAVSSSETVESYTHTISLEIFNLDSALIWKGESTWDSYNIDLSTDIITALQILISWLPNDNMIIPKVAEVNNTKKDNYYNLFCKGSYFSCPALPYRIAFNYSFALENNRNVSSPSSVVDPRAYDAFLDLLQTAEYALPLGGSDYSFPLDKKLWSDVEIGGKYYIGKDSQPSNILIKLTGELQGYRIVKCWIADQEEYNDFQSRLFNWRQALKIYYNVHD